jgi:peptide/nickel transport system substrate-binding protein
VVASFCLVAASCSSSSKTKGSQSTATTAALPPQVGGTLTFGEFSEPVGLDPIVSTGHATTGAIEMDAVYDTILRYNHTTGKYENITAESVTNNADFTVWTVKIKPGIKFSDGTDYNADAVVFGMNRHRSGLPGAPACQTLIACPTNPTSSTSYMRLVKDIQALDPLTVQITLIESWSGFPYVLSAEPSLIPSPTALKKCDPAVSPRQCPFSLAPVGAGPFMVTSFKPGEGITMVRNPTYFGGQVYLDGLHFINDGDAGGMKTLADFKNGTMQAAFLRAPDAVSQAIAENINGWKSPQQSGGLLLMNLGYPVTCAAGKPAPTCTGKPDGPTPGNPATKSLQVRQAIAAAIDPTVIDQRANAGKGFPTSDMLTSDFKWNPGVPGPKYDPAAAKNLVTQAKAATGWDGKVRLLFNNSPSGSATGLAVDAMLKAAGIDSQLDISKTVAQATVQYTVMHDFDIVGSGFSIGNDEGAMVALAQNLTSNSPSNRIAFKDPVIDQALVAIRSAKTDADRTAGYKTIAQEVNAQVPFATFAKVVQDAIWSPKVHGVMETMRDCLMFDKAWIEK